MMPRASSLLSTLLLGCYSIQDVSVPVLLSESDSDPGVVTAVLIHDHDGPTPLLMATADGVSTVYRGCEATGPLALWLPESSTVAAMQFPVGRIVETTGRPLSEAEVCVRGIDGCVASSCGSLADDFTVERRRTCWKHEGRTQSELFKYAEWSQARGWVSLPAPESDRIRCSFGLEVVDVTR
jgi:hypothetical protein